MRVPKKEELAAMVADAAETVQTLSIALAAVLDNDPERPVHFIGGRRGLSARLVDPRRADGGVVIITYRYAGQRPSHTVKYTEVWLHETYENLMHMSLNDPDAAALRGLRADVDFARREALKS